MSKIEENKIDQNDNNLLKIKVIRMPQFAGDAIDKKWLTSCIESPFDFITTIISLKREMKATTRNIDLIKFFKYWDLNKKYLRSMIDSKLICEFPNINSKYILDLRETVFHPKDVNDDTRGELSLIFDVIEINDIDKIEPFVSGDCIKPKIKILKVPEFLQKDDDKKLCFIEFIENPCIFRIRSVDKIEGDLRATTNAVELMKLIESWNLVTQIHELHLDVSLYCEFKAENEKYRLNLRNYAVGINSDSYDSKIKEMSMTFDIIKIDVIPEGYIKDTIEENDISTNNNEYKIGNKYYNETSRLQFDTKDKLNKFVKEHNIENYKTVYSKAFDQFNLYPLVERNEELKIENIELPKFIKTYLSTSELTEMISLIKGNLKLFISSTAKAIVGYTNNRDLKKFFKLWYNGVYPATNDHFYYGQADEILNKTYVNETASISINHDCYTIYNMLISKRMQTLEEDNDTLEIYFDVTSNYVDEKEESNMNNIEILEFEIPKSFLVFNKMKEHVNDLLDEKELLNLIKRKLIIKSISYDKGKIFATTDDELEYFINTWAKAIALFPLYGFFHYNNNERHPIYSREDSSMIMLNVNGEKLVKQIVISKIEVNNVAINRDIINIEFDMIK